MNRDSRNSTEPTRTTLFAVVPEWVLAAVSPRAVQVYAYLDRHANRDGEAWPSVRRLAELCRCDQTTVRKARDELTKAHAIAVIERRRDDGSQTSNAYVLRRDPHDFLGGGAGADTRGASGADARPHIVPNESQRNDDVLRTSEGEESPPVPALTKIVGRNLGFDALAEVCGVDPSGNRAGLIAQALNGGKAIKVGIRELCWREECSRRAELGDEDDLSPALFEQYVASRIKSQARAYRRALPGATLTPTALAKWWTDLHDQLDEGRMTPEQIAEYGATGE